MADLIDRDTQPTHGSTMWMEVSRNESLYGI